MLPIAKLQILRKIRAGSFDVLDECSLVTTAKVTRPEPGALERTSHNVDFS